MWLQLHLQSHRTFAAVDIDSVYPLKPAEPNYYRRLLGAIVV